MTFTGGLIPSEVGLFCFPFRQSRDGVVCPNDSDVRKEFLNLRRNISGGFHVTLKGGALMPFTIDVRLAKDHVDRLSRVPAKEAICELIWNSLDADADMVVVKLERDVMGGLTMIEIADNGHGIEYEKVKDLFGYLGNSAKRLMPKSPNNRYYHGKLGKGRYKSFSLGSVVTWKSIYCDASNQLASFDITGHRNVSIGLRHLYREFSVVPLKYGNNC